MEIDERVLPALVVDLVERIIAFVLWLLDREHLGFVEHRSVEAEDALLLIVGEDLVGCCGRHGGVCL